MNDLIGRLAGKLPGPWDAIIGIPRGGLIVAALLGYALDVQRIESVVIDYVRDGNGRAHPVAAYSMERFQVGQRILLVEDATDTGRLLNFARPHLADRGAPADITTAALWVRKDSDYRPDVWLEEVDTLPSAQSLIVGGGR